MVNQYYEAQVYDVFVIKGNTAVFKCQIPSFVSDHVEIVSWQDTDNNKYLPPVDDYGIFNLMIQIILRPPPVKLRPYFEKIGKESVF